MKEDFLHYIWKYQKFSKNDLVCTDGKSISIIKVGLHNLNSGPDFENSRIILDGIEWGGNVEIHLKSSDWNLHNHSSDLAYQNVILHVVFEHNSDIYRNDGSKIPTLELKNIIWLNTLEKYNQLINNGSDFACESFFKSLDNIHKLNALEKALAARLDNKAKSLNDIFLNVNKDFEELTYRVIAQNLGFKLNSEPFYQLASNLPLRIIQKHGNNIFQLESFLFGQAGFLDIEGVDEYSQKLFSEYSFLSNKYRLEKGRLEKSQWRFLRTRPANFPTLRIAQFAAILFNNQSLFSLVISFNNLNDLREKMIIPVSDYWKSHWYFGKESNSKGGFMGETAFNLLLINSVCQILAFYAEFTNEYQYFEKALKLLEELPPEKNKITRKFEDLGLVAKSAFDSQAMIQQYNFNCLPKKCLSCPISINYLNQ